MHFPLVPLLEPTNQVKLSQNCLPACRARFQHSALLNEAAKFQVEGVGRSHYSKRVQIFLIGLRLQDPKFSDGIPPLGTLKALCVQN